MTELPDHPSPSEALPQSTSVTSVNPVDSSESPELATATHTRNREPPTINLGDATTGVISGIEVDRDEEVVDAVPFDEPPSYVEVHTPQFSAPVRSESHIFDQSHHFPSGLFMLRNRSSSKVLDVRGSDTRDGTGIIAYSAKRPVLKDGDMMHKANNQLFFLDWHGCLCAGNCSLRVDVNKHSLQLAAPRPIVSLPSPHSHPPAQFKYDLHTSTITVHFPHAVNTSAEVEYLLEVVPERQLDPPPSANLTLDKLAEWLPFAKMPSTPIASTSAAPLRDSDVPGSEAGPSEPSPERFPDPDDDTSTNAMRDVRVVSVPLGWRDKFPETGLPEAKPWKKRQWDIVSVVVQPQRPPEVRPIPPRLLPSSTAEGRRGLEAEGEPEQRPLTPGVIEDFGSMLGDIGSEISRVWRRGG